MYVTGIIKQLQAHKVYICLISVNIASCVCMNNYFSAILRTRSIKFADNMYGYCTQVKLVFEFDHAPIRTSKTKISNSRRDLKAKLFIFGV